MANFLIMHTADDNGQLRRLKTYHRNIDNSVSYEPVTDYISNDSEWNNAIIVIDNNTGNYKLYFNNTLALDYSFNTGTTFYCR